VAQFKRDVVAQLIGGVVAHRRCGGFRGFRGCGGSSKLDVVAHLEAM
jgi:hypothetical protein